jgi:hypothetical protein
MQIDLFVREYIPVSATYLLAYGFSNNFPVVFRPSISVCALAISLSGYVS